MTASNAESVLQSIGQEAKKAYASKLAASLAASGASGVEPDVRVDVYVVDKDGNRVGETVKVTDAGRRLSHGGNHVVVEVFISIPEGLSAADAAVAQAATTASAASLPVNIGQDSAFAGLLSVAGVTAAELTASPAVEDEYVVSASPPPPCSMQCTQLMNGLSKKDPDMCLQYGTDSMGNTDSADLKCYPYGYGGCDSGMTHCNQKVCATKDKRPSKCQKKLITKGKLSKCSKRKWGRKKCKKTCCEAGY
jgi:hypothetical protein